MKEDNIEQQASLYVLDMLSDEEREAFEQLLGNSSELKQLVRELRKSLFDPAGSPDEPMRMDLLAGVHEKLDVDWRRNTLPVRAERAVSILNHRNWAIAAMVLLGLNLLLLFKLVNQEHFGAKAFLSHNDQEGASATGAAGEASDSEEMKLLAQIERLRSALSEKEKDLMEQEETLATLASENQEIRSFNAGWQREYTRLAAKFLPFFESNDGLSRFTVIEMVDEESYIQGDRRGFTELAGSFLIGGANIAAVGDLSNVGPVAAGVGLQTANDASAPGLAPAMRPDTEYQLMADLNLEPETDFSFLNFDVADSPAMVDDGEPAGFTVWRDDEQKGFLDIYNLPEASSGESPFLWVRASDLEPYIPVGFLPELDNGTGSLFYEVDEANFTPAEILVTSEQDDAAGSAPSGTVLLRGP